MSINFKDYIQLLYEALNSVSLSQLEHATAILTEAYHNEKNIFMAGNGQSATTANAFTLDLTKQSSTPPHKPRFRTISLASNVAALTAWGNDLDFDAIFVEQLKSLFYPGDILLAISASGNSPNIVKASRWVNDNGGKVIGLTGFSGGQLCEIADACVLVDIQDYGHAETAHIAITHYWVDLFREKLAD